jgi:ADP-ribose pyrophosphatase YjhB (NUDIX family)
MTQRFKTARCILYREDRFLLAIHNRFWPGTQRWGLPGGQIEWGESPHVAAARELEEELQLYLPDLTEVGAYHYKRAMHMVFAAPLEQDIAEFDDTELLDVRWFTEDEIAGLKRRASLHAGYELDAVQRLCGDILAAAS